MMMDERDNFTGYSWKDHVSGNDVESAQEEMEHEAEKSERVLRLPLARVKHIMKIDPDVHFASQEAVFLITKSTVSVGNCFTTYCSLYRRTYVFNETPFTISP
jgi:Cdc6-like AAA superfamily ATPase